LGLASLDPTYRLLVARQARGDAAPARRI